VDIDLNYIGQLDRAKMQEERPIINDAIQQICRQNQFTLDRNPTRHAGGKIVWRYPSVLGQMGNLEIDLNYMYRRPLWPIEWRSPNFQSEKAMKIPVLDIHELTGGKLAALFSREVSRDLFDSHYLLTKYKLLKPKLRLAFVIYVAMTDIDLSKLKHDFINYNINDIRNRLIPLLRQNNLQRSQSKIKSWATTLITELHNGLNQVIPLKQEEIDFILQIRKDGKIIPELITDDEQLHDTIKSHPAILWAATKSKIKKKVTRVKSTQDISEIINRYLV
jgi:hypothetical protein